MLILSIPIYLAVSKFCEWLLKEMMSQPHSDYHNAKQAICQTIKITFIHFSYTLIILSKQSIQIKAGINPVDQEIADITNQRLLSIIYIYKGVMDHIQSVKQLLTPKSFSAQYTS